MQGFGSLTRCALPLSFHFTALPLTASDTRRALIGDVALRLENDDAASLRTSSSLIQIRSCLQLCSANKVAIFGKLRRNLGGSLPDDFIT
jgi:hypothetical protein